MALSILKELLDGYLQSLFDEGLVNDQFSRIQTLKSVTGADFVVQLVDSYFAEMETLLSEISIHNDLPAVDFSKLALLAGKVKELSTGFDDGYMRHRIMNVFICNKEKFGSKAISMGAEQVRLSCANLIEACDQKNKHNFSQALIWTKNEFGRTRNKLEAYAQMERRIIRVQRRQQK